MNFYVYIVEYIKFIDFICIFIKYDLIYLRCVLNLSQVVIFWSSMFSMYSEIDCRKIRCFVLRECIDKCLLFEKLNKCVFSMKYKK